MKREEKPQRGDRERQHYAAMLELVGVRDLAAEDPLAYRRAMRQLFVSIRASLKECDCDVAGEEIAVCGFLDKCIAGCVSFEKLVRFLVGIRDKLINESPDDNVMFMRAVVIEAAGEGIGGIGAEESKELEDDCSWDSLFLPFSRLPDRPDKIWRTQLTYGYHLRVEGVELFGKLERFKGIGIVIPRNLVGAATRVGGIRVLENVFIPDSNRLSFQNFSDVGLTESCMSPRVLEKTVEQMVVAKHRSKKLARLYIPLLSNWVRSADLSARLPDSACAKNPMYIDAAITRGAFEFLRQINGYQGVFWAIAERLYGRSFEHAAYEESRKEEMLGKLKRRRWMAEVMVRDKVGCDIPEELCSLRAQRRYSLEMSKIPEGGGSEESVDS